jgi:hypothetical protein
MDIIIKDFEGTYYRLANNWYEFLDVFKIRDVPINYLEIGTFYGANLLSVACTYGLHPSSKLYCIDPWQDYDEYPEYKNEQNQIYSKFLKNIENCTSKDKIIINKGFSHIELLKFENDFFDIIYIDGNHEPEYVLEDAVLSFRKLKVNGVMIFDDYGWTGEKDLTQMGIDCFLKAYQKRIQYLGIKNLQVFIQKLN